jgi:carboxyl-terminal processing protease
MRSHRLSLVALGLSIVGAFSATSAVAAPATVTRAEFIRTAITTLRVEILRQGTVTYMRIPAPLIPYVRTAESHGAMVAFSTGTTVDLQRAVTRGEALQFLAALLDRKPTDKLAKSYPDVKSDAYKNAAEVALEQKWARPLRPNMFGMNRTLSSADMKLLLAKVVRSQGVTVQSPTPTTIRINLDTLKNNPPKQDILQSVWNLLNDQYLYKDKLGSTESGYSTVEGLVKSLNDPYTVFFKPANAKDFQTQLQGEVIGIGAQVEQKAGVLTIVAPLAGSPAEKAGLKPGDEILAVNGESLAGLSYEDGVSKVRGPKGTTANLHIRRNGDEMDVAVVRDLVRIEDLAISFRGDIAVVELHQFGQLTDDEFRAKMTELSAKHPRGIVLDLRNNPGGLLDAAGVVSSVFLPNRSPYVIIQTASDSSPELTQNDPIFGSDVPLVVLVNKGSASAAEIVAGALQDSKRATLVGEKTFGKGTVQQVVDFKDGSSLKMTIAEWHTPKGRKIDGIGLEPDVTMNQGGTGDAQLDRAVELIH